MTISLELAFLEPRQGDLPGPRRAQIYVKNLASDEYVEHAITPICVTIGEFESEIDRLYKELEEVRMEARRKFQA